MTISLSVGSGKGGVGKSMLAANLAILLAKAGRRVCIADLDLGGADIHILFGMFAPRRSLSDFLRRDAANLEEIILDVPGFHNLRILPGAGDTLQTANMTFAEKQRLLRALSAIDTDVLLLDIGAGVSLHTLDFFMMSELQICVTTPEPTAVMDFYTFLQLSTIRRAMSAFSTQHPVNKALREKSFKSLAEVLALAETMQPGAKMEIEAALRFFNPLLVVNMVGAGARVNLLKLRQLSKNYLGIFLPTLGEIPFDAAVQEALRSFIPVAESAPRSAAGQALSSIADKAGKVIDLCLRKRQPA
ncbi:MAG: P-loop NTPase [Desulfobulbaceae bacterium]|jgi:flagellar biosynthesis protein FlhG|nr:P-loop NTPase [Desulfobulbaceae bacterium]